MEEKDLAYYIDSLLKYGVDYVGVINAQGRMVEHTSKALYLNPEKLEILCMGIRLQYSMNADFDDDLGTVNHTVTERGKLKFISVPIIPYVLFAIAKKEVNHMPLVRKITSKQFFPLLKNKLDGYNLVTVGI